MDDEQKNADWLTSVEAQKALRISSCDLMHLRKSGALRFQKKGNAFFYAKQDIEGNRGKRRSQ